MSSREISKVKITIPQEFIGRLIGSGGKNIKIISFNSNAQLRIDDEVLTITGTEEEIKQAKAYIKADLKKFKESTEWREKKPLCFYGSDCKRNNCRFTHPTVASPKWKEDERRRKNKDSVMRNIHKW